MGGQRLSRGKTVVAYLNERLEATAGCANIGFSHRPPFFVAQRDSFTSASADVKPCNTVALEMIDNSVDLIEP